MSRFPKIPDKLKGQMKTAAKKTGRAIGKGMEKGGKMAVKEAKRRADQHLSQSQEASGIAYRGYKKGKKLAKQLKRLKGWLIKFVQFCISNPAGWLVALVVIGILMVIGDQLTDAMKNAAEKFDTPVVVQKENKDYVDRVETMSNGRKLVTILIDCKSAEASSSSSTDSDAASDSDWLKEGTTAYKNAKAMFDTWTNAGLSGSAAAGMLGWVNSEGGFSIIGRAEGHYGGRIEDVSIKYGAVPTTMAHYPVGKTGKPEGGGGIYQFTPYTKYGMLKEDKWEDGEAMTKYVISQLPRDWIPAADKTGGNHSFEDFARSENAEEAALMWNAYERGLDSIIDKILDKKRADARKANEVFNKDKIKFNKAKFDKTFGSSKDSDGKDSEDDTSYRTQCRSESGGDGWAEDGTGSHNYKGWAAWTRDQLPADLKRYALDPTSVGVGYKTDQGWDILNAIPGTGVMHDQCTGLTAVLGYHLWVKDGKHPLQTGGHGVLVAKMWKAMFGGKLTDKPTAGAIFSSVNDNEYGHTGIVSHRFEDGSILIVEQNVQGLSGANNGERHNWSYRIISKDEQKRDRYEFYNPADVGYKLNPKAKAMG